MTRFQMTLLAGAAGAALFGFAQPAQAIEYPWCAQYNGGEDGGGRNCGFVSYEQCMMTARGAGASCEPNLFYPDQQKQRPQPRQRPSHG